jgi:hypothetical protein
METGQSGVRWMIETVCWLSCDAGRARCEGASACSRAALVGIRLDVAVAVGLRAARRRRFREYTGLEGRRAGVDS